MSLEFTRCCCGCSLRTGACLIGMSYFFLSLTIISIVSILLYRNQDDSKLVAIFITLIVYEVIQFMTSVCVCVSASGEVRCCIPAWIVLNLTGLVLYAVVLTVIALDCFQDRDISSGSLCVASALMYEALTIYFVLIIASFSREVQRIGYRMNYPEDYDYDEEEDEPFEVRLAETQV